MFAIPLNVMRDPPNLVPADRVGRDGPRGSVLIVEDERVARRALVALLAASGFQTAAAASAEEALRVVSEQPPPPRRIALVDLNLPGMNGVDFISRLERIDPDVFSVLMTAASDEVIDEALRDRHLLYLRKPLDVGELLDVISHSDERQP